MKTILVFTLALLFNSAWAIDVNLKLVQPKKNLISSKMICEKNSCVCPEDTILNTDTMNCNKCPEGFVLNSNNRACIDPNFQAAGTVKDLYFVKAESIQAIKDSEGSTPVTCDMRTIENGKFKSCTCEDKVFSVATNSKKKLTLSIQNVFNVEAQKCEAADSVVANIPNQSCYGPYKGAFDKLAKQGFIEVKYTSPSMSLGMCGATDGNHIITFKKPELMVSIIDALLFTLDSDLFEGKVESYEIDPGSINY